MFVLFLHMTIIFLKYFSTDTQTSNSGAGEWLSGGERLLLFRRTWIQSPASTGRNSLFISVSFCLLAHGGHSCLFLHCVFKTLCTSERGLKRSCPRQRKEMYLSVLQERTLQPVPEESLNILTSHRPIIPLPVMWAFLSSTSEAIENFTQNTILEVWKELSLS